MLPPIRADAAARPITLELDLKPFYVVVQRGTNHGCVNKGSTPAVLVAVLVDADPT